MANDHHASAEAAVLSSDTRHEWERSLLRRKLSRGSNHVLFALLRHAGGGPECWPTNESLALDTGIGERQVRRNLVDLERGGVIAIEIDRSLKAQRRIVFPSHPSLKRRETRPT